MAKVNPLLIVGGLAVLALMMARKPKEGEAPQPTPRPTLGPAVVQGNLGIIQVTQGAAMAATASSPVLKVPNKLAMVSVPWLGTTTNAGGTRIAWPYRVRIRIGHNTALGWKDIGQLFPAYSGEIYTSEVSLLGGQTEKWGLLMPDDPNQIWDVHVHLLAKTSDAAGVPTADWKELAFGELVGAFKTLPGAATVSGSLGTIVVSQQQSVGRIGLRW